jgi:hypothetical protein
MTTCRHLSILYNSESVWNEQIWFGQMLEEEADFNYMRDITETTVNM